MSKINQEARKRVNLLIADAQDDLELVIHNLVAEIEELKEDRKRLEAIMTVSSTFYCRDVIDLIVK